MKKKILYVYAPSGPPIDYLMPKMASKAEIVTLFAITPTPQSLAVVETHSKLSMYYSDRDGRDIKSAIVEMAKVHRVDAVVTFSEYLLEATSLAAAELRLKNAGPNVLLAREKILMRERWARAGIPQPHFMEVKNPEDVRLACRQIGVPLLLKVANGAGSIGQQIVGDESEAEEKLTNLLDAVEQAWMVGKKDPMQGDAPPQLLAEAIIKSTTESWYEDRVWGDYLSVEGIVRGGVYHPLAITGRLPTIPPFIEVSNIAPCPLARPKKDIVVEAARRAIDALELQDCATHTEIKLCKDGTVQLIETAARMGGVAIAKEVEHVYGIDYIGLLIDTLLGHDGPIPAFEPQPPACAAASLSLIGVNAKGEPWQTRRRFEPARVDWTALAGPQVEVFVEYTQSMSPGDNVPLMFSAGGTLTNAGIAFVTAPGLDTLLPGLLRILNGLEHALPQLMEPQHV